MKKTLLASTLGFVMVLGTSAFSVAQANGNCIYADKVYSPGSVVTMVVKECKGGKWVDT